MSGFKYFGNPDYVTVSEFAKIHNMKKVTINQRCLRGTLPFVTESIPAIGQEVRFIKKDTPCSPLGEGVGNPEFKKDKGDDQK